MNVLLRVKLRRPAGLVVDAHQQLADQPGGDQLRAHQHQHHAGQQQRAPADGVAHQLVQQQPQQDQHARRGQPQPQPAEGVQRALAVAHEEHDQDQIQDDAEGAVDAVLGHAARARVVAHRHLGDARARLLASEG
jgi:hypothetical protein